MSRSSSKPDLRVEFKEIHTSEPTGSWSRLAHLLTSLSELYIIFERVCSLGFRLQVYSLGMRPSDGGSPGPALGAPRYPGR